MILFTARYWLQYFIANENFDLNMKTLILKKHRQSYWINIFLLMLLFLQHRKKLWILHLGFHHDFDSSLNVCTWFWTFAPEWPQTVWLLSALALKLKVGNVKQNNYLITFTMICISVVLLCRTTSTFCMSCTILSLQVVFTQAFTCLPALTCHLNTILSLHQNAYCRSGWQDNHDQRHCHVNRPIRSYTNDTVRSERYSVTMNLNCSLN